MYSNSLEAQKIVREFVFVPTYYSFFLSFWKVGGTALPAKWMHLHAHFIVICVVGVSSNVTTIASSQVLVLAITTRGILSFSAFM